MPYADTDFLLALIKPDDWLKEPSEALLKKYRDSIWTSMWAIAEILLVCKKLRLNPEQIISSLFELIEVKGISRSDALAAAHLIQKEHTGVFDALHAIACYEDSIISSDTVFDRIGLKRIELK